MPPPAPTGCASGGGTAASGSPDLAAFLGFIPGVGAMYNGEYAKGFIHVLIFATLIWMTDHINGLFGIAIAAFVIYMPIEAYKTAKARQMGLPPPDPFGFNNLFSSGLRANRRRGRRRHVAPVDPAQGLCRSAPVVRTSRSPTDLLTRSGRRVRADRPGRAVPAGRIGLHCILIGFGASGRSS